ncbi:hypothetical protein [Microbulbifer aggregans]|uniref:hypothetical protein n=1 Tax=Microbulbifer aggregans TaxID=1769779 RepID=UPI001CFEC271|nr:hypothetical protein [Microbulbifer aggregans]
MRLFKLVLLAVLLVQNAAFAEPFHFKSEYTPQQIKDFFAKTYTDDIKSQPQRILDPEYARDAQLRFLMVADYIDLNKDLTFLEEYGLKKVSATSYQIDMQRHPGWIKAQDLTTILHPKTFDDFDKNRLREKGLTDKEVALVDAHIQKSDLPAKTQDQFRKYIILHGEDLAAQFFTENADKFSVFDRYRNAIDRQTRQLNNVWLRSLLDQLEPPAQAIFLSFLFESVGKATIFPSSNVNVQIETFFRSMQDGTLQEAMKTAER